MPSDPASLWRMTQTAHGTFLINMSPDGADLGGAANRMSFKKAWRGDLEATGDGVLLSGGDANSGNAGYVVLETVNGSLGGRAGSFLFQQFGTLTGGAPELRYLVVPGSGSHELEGLTGELELTIDEDGTHNYEITYDLPEA